jgi:dienelactone hydrolase
MNDIRSEEISYRAGNITCKGYLAVETSVVQYKRPVVIIAHAWRGLDSFAKEKAHALAKLGYIGFAADLYGDGRVAKNDDEAAALMGPLFLDRKLLRDRIVAAFTTMQNHQDVDPSRIAAIGFCFGGLTVIELLRSGADVRGVVSFHGVLGESLGGMNAEKIPSILPIKGALLLLHGYKDPLVSQQDLVAIQKEFSDANIDWQLDIYGDAAHSFTNPEATNPDSGMVYNESAAKRSWLSMQHFLHEHLSIGEI